MSMGKPKEQQGSVDSRLPSKTDEQTTIGEMARAYNVSLRTLRFYEDRGLLVPRRQGTARYYAPEDRTRLELILHGKQLGFTLTEIRELLAGADKRSNATRLQLRPEQIRSQIAHLERQRGEIDGAIAELRDAQQSLTSPQHG